MSVPMSADSRAGQPPPCFADLPTFDLVERNYRVRLARDASELERALRLRYSVFNVELGEGLAASHTTGLDTDPYDLWCHHLLLIDEEEDRVVGTYRLQTGAMARAGQGFYCAQEFRIDQLPPDVVADSVELGRACVDGSHRMGHALFALWRGLAAYLTAIGKRYLFGCCSLTTQDPAQGLLAHAWLQSHGRMHPQFRVDVQPGFECEGPMPDQVDVDRFELPQLFGTYLRYGAMACGAPAIDREFGTIDFLVLFDLANLDPRLRRLFFEPA